MKLAHTKVVEWMLGREHFIEKLLEKRDLNQCMV